MTFKATWSMLDASDNEVVIEMAADSILDGVNTLAARKEFVEKALERGWTLTPRQKATAVNGSDPHGDTPAPRCEHGARVWKQGTSKNNKPYKGYFCPQQGTDCAPLWVK